MLFVYDIIKTTVLLLMFFKKFSQLKQNQIIPAAYLGIDLFLYSKKHYSSHSINLSHLICFVVFLYLSFYLFTPIALCQYILTVKIACFMIVVCATKNSHGMLIKKSPKKLMWLKYMNRNDGYVN